MSDQTRRGRRGKKERPPVTIEAQVLCANCRATYPRSEWASLPKDMSKALCRACRGAVS